MSKSPSFQYVSSYLRHEDGVLYWLKSVGKSAAGKKAGCVDRYGYWRVGLNKAMFRAHRVVWLLTYGAWPTSALDHINGEKMDNSPSNLRLCNDSQNQMNTKARGKARFKGVTQLPHGRYQAQCGSKYLGSFDSPEIAARAYDTEAANRYGEFARLNFVGVQ